MDHYARQQKSFRVSISLKEIIENIELLDERECNYRSREAVVEFIQDILEMVLYGTPKRAQLDIYDVSATKAIFMQHFIGYSTSALDAIISMYMGCITSVIKTICDTMNLTFISDYHFYDYKIVIVSTEPNRSGYAEFNRRYR